MKTNFPSYEHGSSELSLLYVTIGQLFDRIAEMRGESECLVSRHQSVRYTYSQIKEITDSLAKGFMSLGIKKGDRVGIWSVNRWEWFAVQVATAKIGAILVNINPAYRTSELRYALKQSGTQSIVLTESFKSSRFLDMIREVCPELEKAEPGELKSEALPELRNVILMEGERPGVLSLESLIEKGRSLPDSDLQDIAVKLDPDDPINIQYTSGTTGFPKGVTLTHFNILNNGHHVAHIMKLAHGDRLCVPVPFYHCFGMVMSALASASQGATMVLPGPVFDPESVLQTVQEEKCTGLHGVPTMFIALLNHPDFSRYELSTLRTGIMAGAPCPIDTMKDVMGRMGMDEIVIAYGQTESSPVTTMTRTDDSIERRVGTVGRVMPMQEIKIVDPLTGLCVPRGVQGEICFRGYQVMKGYWENEVATSEAIDSARWLHSGDLGVMDEAGYVKITGRIKEMVIRGGENIYPREIEEFLRTHPDIMDVYVIGVPDIKYGEELMAWILCKEGSACSEESIREFCKGKITHFKIPRYYKFVSSPEDFPMTVTGKIQKYKMRHIAVIELDLESAACVETA